MALRYVGRFATSRKKLLTYLARKLRERELSGLDVAEVLEKARRWRERLGS